MIRKFRYLQAISSDAKSFIGYKIFISIQSWIIKEALLLPYAIRSSAPTTGGMPPETG